MQSFHKDSQRGKPPNHLPRSLFVFYYAGGCSDEMGPTEIDKGRLLRYTFIENWKMFGFIWKDYCKFGAFYASPVNC